MPTSSINKNLLLETEDECREFLSALERSELNTPTTDAQPSIIKELSTQQQYDLIKSLIK